MIKLLNCHLCSISHNITVKYKISLKEWESKPKMTQNRL